VCLVFVVWSNNGCCSTRFVGGDDSDICCGVAEKNSMFGTWKIEER